MTKEKATSVIKQNWQPLFSLGAFIFSCGIFYYKTTSYADDIKDLKASDQQIIKAATELSEKQNQYNTDVAVVKSQITNINDNMKILMRRLK